MATEVATQASNLPADPSALLAGLKGQQETARADASRGSFMKFKKGKYLFGVDDILVEAGSLWAVNPSSFTLGYHAWGNGQLLGDVTARITEPPVLKAALHEILYDDKKKEREMVAQWVPFRGFQVSCTNGEDEGEQCFLSSSSGGFKKAADTLMDAIVAQMEVDPANPVPIIELKFDSYEHNDKEIGEVIFPVFEIVEWLDMEATEVPERDDEDEGEGSDEGQDEGGPDAAALAAAEQAKASKEAGRGRAKKDKAMPTGQRRTRRRRGES